MVVDQKVHYVPWADISEWEAVKNQIFSSDIQDIIRAYETILTWKLKYDSVPAYIECTYSLLQVMVKEYDMTKNKNPTAVLNEHDLQLSYSTALIRFVNHVSSLSSYRGETLYWAAKTQNIPDWIINMRHSAAHGQDLPTLDALHIAAEFSLNWLMDNYWANTVTFTENSLEMSQLDSDPVSNLEIDISAGAFFKKAFDIWELCHKVNNIQFIREMEKEFFLHLEEFINLNTFNYSYEKNEEAEVLQNIVSDFSKKEKNENSVTSTVKFKEFKILLLKYLKKVSKTNDRIKHSLVLSLLDTKFLKESESQPEKWSYILSLIQDLGMFSMLLQLLFQMSGTGLKEASKWLTTLAPSLKLLSKQWPIFKLLKKEYNNYKAKEIKQKILKSCKSNDSDLVIKLGIFKPPEITLDILKNVLLNPECFTAKTLLTYLKLVTPPLSKSAINLMTSLIKLHSVSKKKKDCTDEESEKIYTIEDLEDFAQKDISFIFEKDYDKEMGWKKSSIDVHTWSKCPLGLLPFQSKVDCSLQSDLVWCKKQSTKKRAYIPLLRHTTEMKKRKLCIEVSD